MRPLQSPSVRCLSSPAADRPPWHVATTAEVAQAADIPFSTLSNWIVRGRFPRPEPRHLFFVDGNKRLFRIDLVTGLLGGPTSEEQAISYLEQRGLAPNHPNIWQHVRLLERLNVFEHRWQPRDLEAYLATLPKPCRAC